MNIVSILTISVVIVAIIVFVVIYVKRNFFDKKQLQKGWNDWKINASWGMASFVCGCIALVILPIVLFLSKYENFDYVIKVIRTMLTISSLFLICFSVVCLVVDYIKKRSILWWKTLPWMLFWILLFLFFLWLTIWQIVIRWMQSSDDCLGRGCGPCPQPTCYDDDDYCPRVYC